MTKSVSDAVLLASGGLDSTTLAYWLRKNGRQFLPVFIDYGQHCAVTEYERLQEVLPEELFGPITKLDISAIYQGSRSRLVHAADLWSESISSDDLYLPYRNLLMLAVGASFAQSHGLKEVFTAFINSNHATEIDCSATFFDRLGSLLSDFGSVKIQMPFRDFSKRTVAQIGMELDAPIARTFSCQAAAQVPCGACPNCRDRLTALEGLGSF